MKRQAALALTILTIAALALTGCSKDKQSKETLQGEIAQLKTELKQSEDRQKQLTSDADKAALKASEEKVLLEDALKAFELRTLLQRPDAFRIEPFAPTDNGWLIIDGEHAYTLFGYPEATKVVFYWAVPKSEPQKLGEDTTGKDGWTWRGTIPPGNLRAFFAEIHYPAGIKVFSPVLALRSGGK